MSTPPAPAVGPMIRAWRSSRGKSQLALALEAGVSTRHLSFVETGRASPSREMILTLAEHLDVPLRDRNALLEAAGYAAAFRETPLDAAAMSEVRAALAHILEASEPNPALVVNRRYDVLLANAAAVELLAFFAPRWRGKNNVARMLLSDEGLKPAVANWPEAAGHVVRRLRGELSAGARDAEDDEVLALANAAHAALSPEHAAHAARPPRVLVPVTLRRGDFVVDLFTTITTLGTPLDITLQELRIETFFAATAASKDALAIVTRGGVD
ncbi:MAG TPA: helix-turn-helix transcriptional regulator [Polyangiaceae bacterium]|nr:helix-turn-helix transcriptional regulator [Polyangiaceae bacterium]